MASAEAREFLTFIEVEPGRANCPETRYARNPAIRLKAKLSPNPFHTTISHNHFTQPFDTTRGKRPREATTSPPLT
jgi:hypothetical protein